MVEPPLLDLAVVDRKMKSSEAGVGPHRHRRGCQGNDADNGGRESQSMHSDSQGCHAESQHDATGGTAGGVVLGLCMAALAVGVHGLALSSTVVGVIALAASAVAVGSDTGLGAVSYTHLT